MWELKEAERFALFLHSDGQMPKSYFRYGEGLGHALCVCVFLFFVADPHAT